MRFSRPSADDEEESGSKDETDSNSEDGEGEKLRAIQNRVDQAVLHAYSSLPPRLRLLLDADVSCVLNRRDKLAILLGHVPEYSLALKRFVVDTSIPLKALFLLFFGVIVTMFVPLLATRFLPAPADCFVAFADLLVLMFSNLLGPLVGVASVISMLLFSLSMRVYRHGSAVGVRLCSDRHHRAPHLAARVECNPAQYFETFSMAPSLCDSIN